MIVNQWKKHIRNLQNQNKLSKDLKLNADNVLKNVFVFKNEYAMEPTNIPYKMETITWQHSPNGDPEWLFMLKRQEYLVDLLAAYYETDDVAYQDKMKELLLDWIDNNIDNPKSWRTLDTGIRLLNWTPVLENLINEKRLSNSEKSRIDAAVKKQALYLKDEYIEKYDISNWGVLITTGILVFDSRFPSVIDKNIVQWATEKFEIELTLQVDQKGAHWEQSPLYLLEVLRSSLAVVASYLHSHREVPQLFMDKCKKMQLMLQNYIKPNGLLVQQGDTDAISVDSLLNSSSLITKVPVSYKNIKNVYDFLLIELYHSDNYGMPEIAQTTHLIENGGGNYFWRSGWSKDADFWHVFNGNLGSGHGHAQLGHVDLTIQGQDVLVDPGRYTYVDGTERRYLKSTQAHNTVLIDDIPFSKPKNSWKYDYVSTPINVQQEKFEDGLLTRISYIDQSTPDNFVIVRNWISLPEFHVYIMIDQVFAKGQHTLHNYWQLNPAFDVTEIENGYRISEKFKFLTTANEYWTSRSLFSPKYNKLSHLTRVESRTVFSDFICQTNVFGTDNLLKNIEKVVPMQSGSNKLVLEQLATGLRINLNNGYSYLITMQPENTIKGRKLYWYGNVESYGTLNIYKIKDNNMIRFNQIL